MMIYKAVDYNGLVFNIKGQEIILKIRSYLKKGHSVNLYTLHERSGIINIRNL